MSRISFASRSSSRFVAAGLLAAVLAACNNSNEPKKDITPATITPSSVDTLRGQVGSQLNTTLVVTVKNAAGQPIDSALVTFAVASGGGTLAASTVRTDTLGRATNTWTLGNTAGVQTVTATVGALPAVTFVAVAGARAASSVTKVSGDAQTGIAGAALGTRPSVKVTDQFGNPVPNTLVTFAVASGGGQVTGGAANTDVNGLATVGGWTLGKTAGANTLTATVAGAPAVTFTATGTPGPVAQLKITNTAPTLTSGQTFKFTVQALDANNNVVANPTVTFSSDNAAVATVDASGTVTATGAGTATISAASGGVTTTAQVSVIGHPGQTLVGNVAMSSRVRDVSIVGTTAYAALSTAQAVGAADISTATPLWTLGLGATVVGVAANSTNTLVTAATGGLTPQFFFINPATHQPIDSLPLTASAVAMAMTSTGTRALVDENNFTLEVVDIPTRSIVAQVALAGTVTAMRLARGDTVVYAGTALGVVYEINANTGAIKRRFQPSNTVVSLDVSADGKTLFVADGSPIVTMIPLATGGLSGPVDFGTNVQGIGITPDFKQLWALSGSVVIAAPFSNNTFDTSLFGGRLTVTGANLTKIFFTQLGNFAVLYDDGALQLVILK